MNEFRIIEKNSPVIGCRGRVVTPHPQPSHWVFDDFLILSLVVKIVQTFNTRWWGRDSLVTAPGWTTRLSQRIGIMSQDDSHLQSPHFLWKIKL